MNAIVFYNQLLCGGKKRKKRQIVFFVCVERCTEYFRYWFAEETQELIL